MSNTPIAQIAVSTIKGTEKQNIYPKTIDRAVLTTDKEGNEDTLDNVLIKGIDINGETVTPDENGVVNISGILPDGDDLEAFADESAGQVSVRLKDKTGDNHSRKVVWLRPKEGYVYPDSCIILLQGYYDGTNCTANNITKAATISTTALSGDPNGIVQGLKDNKIYAYTFDGSTYTLYTSWSARSVELQQDRKSVV